LIPTFLIYLKRKDTLQFVAAGDLCDALLVSLGSRLVGNTLSDALGALPAESLEALSEMGVGEVEAGIHPVGVHGAKVLNLELEERAGELLRIAQTLGEVIGLELKLASNHVHEELDDDIGGGEGVREEDEADDDGVLLEEAKGVVQRGVVDEDRE
jgi:hypothetical protein